MQSQGQLDLADEYSLSVFPYLAGSGKRLFDHLDTGRGLALVSTLPSPTGLSNWCTAVAANGDPDDLAPCW